MGVPLNLNNTAKYVELSVEGLRTRVRFPPAPPNNKHHPSGGVFVCGAGVETNPPRVRLSITDCLDAELAERAVGRGFRGGNAKAEHSRQMRVTSDSIDLD